MILSRQEIMVSNFIFIFVYCFVEKKWLLHGKIKGSSSQTACFCECKEYAGVLKMNRNSVWYLGHLSSNDLDKEHHF